MKIKRTKPQYIPSESSTQDSVTQVQTAKNLGVVSCHSCGKIWRVSQLEKNASIVMLIYICENPIVFNDAGLTSSQHG